MNAAARSGSATEPPGVAGEVVEENEARTSPIPVAPDVVRGGDAGEVVNLRVGLPRYLPADTPDAATGIPFAALQAAENPTGGTSRGPRADPRLVAIRPPSRVAPSDVANALTKASR